jgi:hypothetical protein
MFVVSCDWEGLLFVISRSRKTVKKKSLQKKRRTNIYKNDDDDLFFLFSSFKVYTIYIYIINDYDQGKKKEQRRI